MDRKTVLLGVLVMAFAGVLTFQLLRSPVPINLREWELDYFSQSGEDGVIRKLFEIIKPTSHYVVDFGCGNGTTNSNSRRLVVDEGWSGLLMDGNHTLIEYARGNFANYPKAKIVEAWVYPGNVETLFEPN